MLIPLITSLIAFLLIYQPIQEISAELNRKITVRAARHPSYIRVVFTGDEDVVKKSSVILQKDNTVKIDIKPSIDVEIQPQGILKPNTTIEILKGLKISFKDFYYLTCSERIDDIEVSKIASPHRLVIDIYFEKNPEQKDKPLAQDELLNKQVDAEKTRIDIVVLDAGHGGNNKGLIGTRFVEKEFVLSFVRDLSNYMNKKGIKSMLTRKGDQDLTLRDRIKDRRFDVFLSFHVSLNEEMVVYNLAKPDENQKDIAKEVSSYLGKVLANKVNTRYSPVIPYFYKNQKKGSILIELPNPDKFNYDKKTREMLFASITNMLLALEPSIRE
ncbi:MAG: N-acetylmuramoyl-L-alanine amidase [Thermodesulfovibrionales bacterium]|nr:N-acetylmuramoyl-L-alanine amidase [Thermodesulfovibrionales bacterium]